MIANLIQAFERLSEEDAAFVSTAVVSRATETTRVELLLAAGSSDRVERWHVTAATLLDVSFNFSVASTLSHTTTHPAAIAFNEPRFELYFRGTGPGSAAVLGALYAAHQAVGPASVPFERFFNIHRRLGWLLQSGSGLLATGPEVYLRSYAECLEPNGVIPQIRRAGPALHPAASALLLGESFVVGEGFRAQFLELVGAA